MICGMNWINLFQLYGTEEIFKDANLPEYLDSDTLINTIMDYCATSTPLYTDLALIQLKIKTFFARNEIDFSRLYAAWTADYNPIQNLTRKETFKRDLQHDSQSEMDSSGNSNGTDITQVSAWDSGAFKNGEKGTSEGSSKTTGKSSLKDHDVEMTESSAEGSIGVITPQDQLEKELKIREKFNLYDIIAQRFFSEFCVKIY